MVVSSNGRWYIPIHDMDIEKWLIELFIIPTESKKPISTTSLLELETGKTVSCDTFVYHTFQHNNQPCSDNVLNSCDARYWGFVPEDQIIGVVTHITYSLNSYTGNEDGFEY